MSFMMKTKLKTFKMRYIFYTLCLIFPLNFIGNNLFAADIKPVRTYIYHQNDSLEFYRKMFQNNFKQEIIDSNKILFTWYNTDETTYFIYSLNKFSEKTKKDSFQLIQLPDSIGKSISNKKSVTDVFLFVPQKATLLNILNLDSLVVYEYLFSFVKSKCLAYFVKDVGLLMLIQKYKSNLLFVEEFNSASISQDKIFQILRHSKKHIKLTTKKKFDFKVPESKKQVSMKEFMNLDMLPLKGSNKTKKK